MKETQQLNLSSVRNFLRDFKKSDSFEVSDVNYVVKNGILSVTNNVLSINCIYPKLTEIKKPGIVVTRRFFISQRSLRRFDAC